MTTRDEKNELRKKKLINILANYRYVLKRQGMNPKQIEQPLGVIVQDSGNEALMKKRRENGSDGGLRP